MDTYGRAFDNLRVSDAETRAEQRELAVRLRSYQKANINPVLKTLLQRAANAIEYHTGTYDDPKHRP